MDRRREVEEDRSINKHMGLFAGKQYDDRCINVKYDVSFKLIFVFQRGTRTSYQAKTMILLMQGKRKREKQRRK